jgi:hypothetical protein
MSIMAKYEPHPTDEGKFQCTLCEYGHGEGNGKSRQSVNRHYNAAHGDKKVEATVIPIEEEETIERVDLIDDETVILDDPDWFSFDMSNDEEEEVATISISPGAASVLKGMRNNPDTISSPKQLEDFYNQQARMMKWVFAGAVDPLFGWYGRGITADPDFTVTRSKSDWKLFEEVAASWLSYREIQLPITPDVVMFGTVLSMYAPVIAKVNRKRSPNRPSLWSRWKSKRAMKKALKREKSEADTWAKD